jgi:UDP-GlcNAc:undecaprenyl-phosphate/decaprenyl-phosphate GlcNAc-1-phosphate transferase
MIPALYTTSPYFLLFCLGIVFIAALCTFVVRWVAHTYHVVDSPSDKHRARRVHTTPTALLGGVAVISAFILGVTAASPWLLGGYLLPKHLIGVVIAAIVLLIGGIVDDKLDIRPQWQIAFPILATLVVIASGIGIDYITNPFGGVIHFDNWNIELFRVNGIPYHFTVWADLFTFCWMMLMIYTTKFLDGMDGLVSSVSVIGLLTIGALSFTAIVWQPETGMLAWIAAAAFLGFLIFNWHPASIFLGESGSTFAGFILGVMAIISGGKIATAVLVLGIPLLDVVWVIVRRLFIEHRSPFKADRKHLHLRLLDAGFSQPRAVSLLVILTAAFGIAALSVQTVGKLRAFIALCIVMTLLGISVVYRYRASQQSNAASDRTGKTREQKMQRKYRVVGIFVVIALLCVTVWTVTRVLEQPDKRTSISVNSADGTAAYPPYGYDVANSTLERSRGYMWRQTLNENEGMLFYFGDTKEVRTFWMHHTYVPLDIIWITDQTVVGIEKNVQPQGGEPLSDIRYYSSKVPVNAVIEVPAGEAGKRGFQVGATFTNP